MNIAFFSLYFMYGQAEIFLYDLIVYLVLICNNVFLHTYVIMK